MKNKFTLWAVLAIFAVSFTVACGGETTTTEETTTEETTTDETTKVDDAAATADPYAAGKKIYDEKCVACHQANGEGLAGAFPPLAKSDYLLADKVRAVTQVLNGSNEKMTVNGVEYATPMPFQVDNHQAAVDVTNYILNAWGNEGGTVTLDEVKDIEIVR